MANTTITPAAGAVALAGVAAALLMTVVPAVAVTNAGTDATATWPAIPNGSPGAAVTTQSWRTLSFQAGGTFGAGGSIRLEGSNDGVNFFALSPAALTSAGLFAALG